MVVRYGGCENERDRKYKEGGGELPHEQSTHKSTACKFRVRIGRSGRQLSLAARLYAHMPRIASQKHRVFSPSPTREPGAPHVAHERHSRLHASYTHVACTSSGRVGCTDPGPGIQESLPARLYSMR